MGRRVVDYHPNIRPFGAIVHAMYEMVVASTDATLDLMLAEANTITDTNCWWAIYEITPLLRSFVEDEISRRTRTGLNDRTVATCWQP